MCFHTSAAAVVVLFELSGGALAAEQPYTARRRIRSQLAHGLKTVVMSLLVARLMIHPLGVQVSSAWSATQPGPAHQLASFLFEGPGSPNYHLYINESVSI